MRPRRQRIILASGSPRRRELLKEHFQLTIKVPRTTELKKAGESPKRYVHRVALEKWVAARSQFDLGSKVLPMVSADTIVAIDGRVLGKPKNQTDCMRMMSRLSGRVHCVSTVVCVGWTTHHSPRFCFRVDSRVSFRKLSKAEITRYVKKNDWQGKAGGYAIQGERLHLIDAVSGSLTSIVGLPVNETLQALAHLFSRPPV